MVNQISKQNSDITEMFNALVKAYNSLTLVSQGNSSLQGISSVFRNKYDRKLAIITKDIDNLVNQSFPVAVIGRWNSGKSTLINALLGDDILPSANREMTSVITKLVYDENKTGIVKYVEKKSLFINLNKLEDYIFNQGKGFKDAEKGLQIEEVIVKHNANILSKGITLIDTPGLSSVSDMNNKLTYNIMPTCNAIIMTFRANDVGGKDNYDLLKRIIEWNFEGSYSVVIIITGSDTLNQKAEKEALESLRQMFSDINFELKLHSFVEPQVCFVSPYYELKYRMHKSGLISYQNLLDDSILNFRENDDPETLHDQSRFDNLLKVLDISILKSTSRIYQVQSVVKKMNNFITEMSTDLDGYISVFESDDDIVTLTDKLSQLSSEHHKMNTVGAESIKRFKIKIDELKEEYSTKRLQQWQEAVSVEMNQYINDTEFSLYSNNKYKLFNNKLKDVLESKIREYLIAFSKELSISLRDTCEELTYLTSSKVSGSFSGNTGRVPGANISVPNITAIMYTGVFLSGTGIGLGAGTTLVTSIAGSVVPVIGTIIGAASGLLIGGISTILAKYSRIKTESESVRKKLLGQKVSSYLKDQKNIFINAIIECAEQYEQKANTLQTELTQLIQERSAEINGLKNDLRAKNLDIDKAIGTIQTDLDIISPFYKGVSELINDYCYIEPDTTH